MRIAGKRVVDATKPLHIEVSKRDAALGTTKDPAKCAAARAIVRTTADAKSARVHLGRTYIEFDDKWVRYKTPDALKVEIVSFDRGAKKEYSAGSYTLYAPAPTDRLGHPRKKNIPTGKTGGRRRRPHIARIHRQIEGVRAHGANR
jgi:hypothetical protein